MCRALRRTSFAFAALCVAACVFSGSASPNPMSVRGKLVLVGVSLNLEDVREDGLYVMNADGSGLRQITHSGSDRQPHWSPDGRSVAFIEEDADFVEQVVVVHADGSGRRMLGISSSLAAPDPWSPDGKRIASGGCGGLCVFDLASHRRTRIALGSDDVRGFSWSPDGRKLAAVDRLYRLVAADATGGPLRILAPAGQYPAWSPDGKQLAFLADHKLELVRATGGAARVVARNATGAPTWSRDGHRLLYDDFVHQSVRVLNVVTHANTRVGNGGETAHWSPNGSLIAYGRYPSPYESGQDVWLAQPNGGSVRQLTGEFPSGLGYTDLDWASGSVPSGPPAPAPDLLQLTATSELELADMDGQLSRAGTPDSVTYRADVLCNADAETESAALNVWTPSTGGTVTTTTPCQDWPPGAYAVTPSLDAWVSQSDLDGNDTVAAVRPGTTEAPPAARWTSGQETPDIGWRIGIDRLVGDGSMIVFESRNNDGSPQLWRIADGTVPHAAPIPLPAGASDLVDADAGRIVVSAGDSGLAVLDAGGAVLSRIPALGTVRIGGDLLGVAAKTTLRVYDADSGTLRYQLPLASRSGVPRLLTVGAGYAVYASGIELHLVRLDSGNDRIVDLPGQDGPLGALLTTDGLFLAYFRGYDAQPARILFVPAANLP